MSVGYIYSTIGLLNRNTTVQFESIFRKAIKFCYNGYATVTHAEGSFLPLTFNDLTLPVAVCYFSKYMKATSSLIQFLYENINVVLCSSVANLKSVSIYAENTQVLVFLIFST